MTTLHQSLELYRDQLHDAIERDLSRRTGPRGRLLPRRRRAVLAVPAALAGGVAAVVAVLAGAVTGGPQVSSADAAVLRHVAAALSPPSLSIVHERATVSVAGAPATLFELWEQTDPPYGYHVIKFGHEGYGRDARTPDDPAAMLRQLVQSGRATVSQTTFNGIPAYRLAVSGAPRPFLNGTSYVARSDYHPLETDTAAGGGEVIRYQSYEYLPATAVNLRLVTGNP